MANKKVDDMQCARDKHLLEAKAKAEKLRQERVKSTIKAADGSSIAWLPVGIFKAKEDFMIHSKIWLPSLQHARARLSIGCSPSSSSGPMHCLS